METSNDGAADRAPSRGPARTLLERELRQAAPPGAADEPGPWREWAALLDELRGQLPRGLPADPALLRGSPFKRAYRRLVHRIARPVSRRSERISGNLAELGMALAQQVQRVELRVESLREGNQETRRRLAAMESQLTELASEVRALSGQLSSVSSSLSAEVAALSQRVRGGAATHAEHETAGERTPAPD